MNVVLTLMPAPALAGAALAVLIAGAARRLTGFGFALLAAPLLSLFLPSQQLVIIILLLQVYLGVPALIEFHKHLEWPMLGQLALGGVLTAPIGAWILLHSDPRHMLFCIGATVILAAGILGFAPNMLAFKPTKKSNLACGMIAGAMSSSVGMPGPPIAVYFMGQNTMAETKRRGMLITTFSALAAVSLVVALPKCQVPSADVTFLQFFDFADPSFGRRANWRAAA